MNWSRFAAASILPIVLATPIVAFCFRTGRLLAGVTLGSGVCFLTFVVFAAWEFGDALGDRRPATAPDLFTMIVVYGFVAMVQVMALYLVRDAVEKRAGDRERDPKWR